MAVGYPANACRCWAACTWWAAGLPSLLPPARITPLPLPTPTPADYGSNLGDFMEGHDLKNLTKISSLEELHTTVATIEESFCTAER